MRTYLALFLIPILTMLGAVAMPLDLESSAEGSLLSNVPVSCFSWVF